MTKKMTIVARCARRRGSVLHALSLFLALFAAILPAARLHAYGYKQTLRFPPAGFAESADVRTAAAGHWLEDEISAVAMRRPETVTDRYGTAFSFSCSLSSRAENLIVTVRPEKSASRSGDAATETSLRTAGAGAANADKAAQGEWRLYRSFSTGQATEIRIFPLEDENVFVSLTPPSNPRKKTGLSIEVYGLKLCENIPIGIDFEKLYTLPLETIYRMTQTAAPWQIFAREATHYGDIQSAVNNIRNALAQGVLYYADDAAFDENGKPVHIEDSSPQDEAEIEAAGVNTIGGVNCSGFAKWLVDGIVRPAAGSGLLIEPLKTPTENPGTHFTEPYRETRDLFFGLDWCRNLAAAVVSLNAGYTVMPAQSGADVRVSVFAGGTGYHKDAGYQVGELLPLLYYLAVTEPGCFYLGALNRVRGGDPPLRQYHHVAAFFPYFTQDGRFTVAVFENAEETPFAAFAARNGDAFVHLSRIKIPEAGRFILQTHRETFAPQDEASVSPGAPRF